MKLDFALTQVIPPPPPAQERSRSHEDDDYLAERAEASKDAEFNRLMQEELARKRQVVPPPLPILPWLPAQQAEEADSAIEVVTSGEGVSATASADPRWFAPAPPVPVATREARTPDATVTPEAPRAEPDEAPVAAGPVRVMVEPGLPPVQPLDGHRGPSVPLVRFPQVVVGHIRQSLRDNQPLTQLDFHISPPHIGPVQLSVALQQGIVSVQLTALSLQAKQALEGQVGSIHAILQAHNLTPGQIRVVTALGGKNGAGAAGQKGEQGFGLFSGGRRKPQSAEDDVAVT